jgi:tetratricopeptide (TPR) repeat protein
MATKSSQATSSPSSSNGRPDDRAGKVHRMPRTLAGTLAPAEDSERKSLLNLYEKAVTLMGQGKYTEAHAAFNKLLEGAPHDLADRIRMYIAACVAQIHQGTTEFRTHEERYDYAISLLNHGQYDDASEHFKDILLENNTADYAFYGLALLSSMVGRSHECLEHLQEAIRLNPMNRIQARGDSDFANMTDDPRFTDLLYPES